MPLPHYSFRSETFLQNVDSFVADLPNFNYTKLCNTLKINTQSLHIVGCLIGDGVDHGVQNDKGHYEVIFPAGTDCSSIDIPISDDNLSEPDENFTVRIMKESLPFGIELGENTATDVMIIDNDSEFCSVILYTHHNRYASINIV